MEQLEDPSWFDVSFGGWDDDGSRDFVDDSSPSMYFPQEGFTDDNSDNNAGLFLETLPPQLHPAVSLGVRRVSSCYFSIQSASEASNSVADLLSLWDDNNNNNNSTINSPRGSWNADQFQDGSSCRHDGGNSKATNQEEKANNDYYYDDDNQYDHTTINNLDDTDDRKSILYHDIMMNVLSFLDTPSLASFSQTARRPNFECFYYLQLQLQRELVVGEHSHPAHNDHSNHDANFLPPMEGVGYISRLSQLDSAEARQVVQEYLDSNSTLRTMPLSHSLAYLQDLLRRHGFYTHMAAGKSPSKALASAALLMTLVGAASFMSAASSSSSGCDSSSTMMMMNMMMNKNADSLAEIPNMLFKVGLAGSIMSAARRSMSNHQAANSEAGEGSPSSTLNSTIHILSMRETAQQMASMVQQLPNQLLQQLQAMQTRMMNGVGHTTASRNSGHDGVGLNSTSSTEVATANTATSFHPSTVSTSSPTSLAGRMFAAFSSPTSSPAATICRGDKGDLLDDEFRLTESAAVDSWSDMKLLPFTPNPYEHLPDHGTVETVDEEFQSSQPAPVETSPDDINVKAASVTNNTKPNILHRKLPSGCVGAFTRAVVRASTRMAQLLKERRKTRFAALTEEQQHQTAAAWIDACSSDETLLLVREMVHHIDVDGFYVGSDGTETCALHAAAFSGAKGVLDFLCQGVDKRQESSDGGLAFVNLQDANGWTALHFAAGANSVSAAEVLVKHGADLLVEAANGYTPLQWAQRLSNKEVMEELQRAECNNEQQLQHQPFASLQYHHSVQRRGRRGPQIGSLTTIASRFFAMIPTHS